MFWRAWYADGTSVSSAQSTWSDLPSRGLIILKVWRDNAPKAMYCGLDAIWWDGGDGRVYQLDVPPPLMSDAEIEARLGRLKFGVQVPNQVYETVYAEALAATKE